MTKLSLTTCLLILIASVFLLSSTKPDWGFFGHKRINRLAVFSLPAEMIGFYKTNIDYLTEHSVDPDKRRYASKFEAIRHYIDLDHWGKAPFNEVPRKWNAALSKYLDIYVLSNSGDTLQVKDGMNIRDLQLDSLNYKQQRALNDFTYHNILPLYYEDDWTIDCDSVAQLFSHFATVKRFDCQEAFAVDRFSEYGILPYHLVKMQSYLTRAFKEGTPNAILRHSSDFGHYLADAHVPLHTTENYNGQLSNQLGIHAFWESRLPELFADDEFDYFVGQAEYIEDPTTYYWQVILDSHVYVESLLKIEEDLKNTYPSDQQFCYEERGTTTKRLECREYSAKYHELLDGQVEERMTKAIRAIGSAWYTAWVDAGQPNLDKLIKGYSPETELEAQKELDKKYQSGKIIGRKHD